MLRNYFAGWENDAEIVDADLLNVLPFRLISYHTIKPKKRSKINASTKPSKGALFFRNRRHLRYKSLMMDSGHTVLEFRCCNKHRRIL